VITRLSPLDRQQAVGRQPEVTDSTVAATVEQCSVEPALVFAAQLMDTDIAVGEQISETGDGEGASGSVTWYGDGR
jgi:hypothetical protein